MDDKGSEEKYSYQLSEKEKVAESGRRLEQLKFYSEHRTKYFTVLWFLECFIAALIIILFDKENHGIFEDLFIWIATSFGIMLFRGIALGVVGAAYSIILEKIAKREIDLDELSLF